MNEHDLFEAIGGADDAYLQEIDQTNSRRLPRHFGLIAAVLALVLTACAAPVVARSFDKVKRGEIVTSPKDYAYISEKDRDGNVTKTATMYHSGSVVLDVAIDEDAPDTVEEYWLPLKLLDYCRAESYTADDTAFSAEFSMDTIKNKRAYGISYRQCVLPKDGHIELDGILGTADGISGAGMWEQCEKAYGDVTTLEFTGRQPLHYIDIHPDSAAVYDSQAIPTPTVRQIFWSDGRYLYCLRLVMLFPTTADRVEEIVTSLTQVDDIGQYLPQD